MPYNANSFMPQVGWQQPTWNNMPQQYGRPNNLTQPLAPAAPQLSGDLVIEVYGRSGAEELPVGPNSKVIVYDKTEDIMYRIQTDDAAHKFITEFDFTPRAENEGKMTDYVPRSEFDALVAQVEALSKPSTRARKAAGDE